MKLLILITAFSYSLNSYACPELQGRYNKCFSELRKINGEYIVDQYQENDYQVYSVQYIDDETGENRQELIKTNNQVEARKERI